MTARPAAGDSTNRERIEHAVHRAIQEASWARGVAMLDSDVAAFRDAVLALPELAALLDAAEKDRQP